MADGTLARMDVLKQGDAIRVANSDGIVLIDTLSTLSIAQPAAHATFLTLSTSIGANLTLTPEHHVPVGEDCCTTLKQATDVAIGETIYHVTAGAAVTTAVATAVTKIAQVAKKGLHSPVTSHAHYPIVDGFVTAFDSATKMHLASYALPLLEATGTTALIRRAFLGRSNTKYIDDSWSSHLHMA